MAQKISIKEKIGYALGDGAANIAWRAVATFLFIFYTDVFGLSPAVVGVLFLVARFSDGISDILMGVIGDRTNTKYGKFRPWILWTAIPLAVSLALLFTVPNFSEPGKIIYAYITYIIFTLIYTANNIPYGALMAVMTSDDKERASIGSYRMVGAFTGGMVVQGLLLYFVVQFGNVNPTINLSKITNEQYKISVISPIDVENAEIKTEKGFAQFTWVGDKKEDTEPTPRKSFQMKADETYSFLVTGQADLTKESFSLINQKKGYSSAIYVMSFLLAALMLITFLTTKERVKPPKNQESNLKQDFKDLIANKPWLVLLIVGLLFNIYGAIKQGIIVIYFSHYLHNQLLAGSFFVVLTLAAIFGAMATAPLSKKWGKKRVFIYALLFSAVVNSLFYFMSPENITGIFTLGIITEFSSAIFPTLFFAMLGDAADYSEFKNGRRATGLVYSAGSLATKFGGGIAGAIIGFVLAAFNYDGQNSIAIEGSIPGIIMLMSWIPAIVAVIAAIFMLWYPLDQQKMDEITIELNHRRKKELTS